MKRILAVSLAVLFLSGCSTYKFQRGEEKPFDQGYVVYRDGYMIPEYSLGENNSVPNDVELAKERFKRRRKMVEYYYRKLGQIENSFERFFWNPCGMCIKTVFGQLKLPFVAISNYKYNHNPQYKEKMIKIDDQRQAKERARVNQIKDQLNTYVQKDLTSEDHKVLKQEIVQPAIITQALPEPPAPETQLTPQEKEMSQQRITAQTEALTGQATVTPEPMAQVEPKPIAQVTPIPKTEEPTKAEPPIKEEEKVEAKEAVPATVAAKPTAVIIAKPAKGYSPLRVQFHGSKSTANNRKGRIVSYSWDFGDGDTSTKENPVNTYYSGSYEPREFSVELTVLDDAGNMAKTNTVIQVLNK